MTAWDKPDGQKAIEIKGPVEWEAEGFRYRLSYCCKSALPFIQWKSLHVGTWRHSHCITTHETACLHRDHARRWLNTRDCAAVPVAALGLGATDKDYIAAILGVGKD